MFRSIGASALRAGRATWASSCSAPSRVALTAGARPRSSPTTQHHRGLSTLRNINVADKKWRVPMIGLVVLIAGLPVGFAVYSNYFGPGSVYPKPIRSLMHEGGMAYLRTGDKQDMPKAIECYTQALAGLDELGTTDPKHARDAPHVTGLVARIAAVYNDMGDLDKAIETFTDLLHRILGDEGIADPKTQVRRLLDNQLPDQERMNILRALGCANMLAEAYEARGRRAKRRSVVLPHSSAAASADAQAAAQWYQWCLQLVMLTYQNHFNHLQLEKNLPPTSTPSFDPQTLPRYFSVDVITSLMYNAATFFASNGQTELAMPLLQRALDLMRRGADGKETNVCRSSILMSHLANAGVTTGDLAAAEKWSLEGLALAKQFPRNADCLHSFVALTYDLGAVYEAAGSLKSARVQYRQAAEIAATVGDNDAARLADQALARAS